MEKLNGIYQRNLDSSGVEVIRGRAVVAGRGTVVVEGRRYTPDHLLLAPGGAPTLPAIPGAELAITSDGFFELKTRPASVLVVGAGYIAVEMAQILAALGTATTLACRGQTVLRSFDSLISEAVTAEVEAGGVTLVRGWETASLARTEAGLVATSTTGATLPPVEVVLMAVGRRPATEGLGCQEAGVDLDAGGHVLVDALQNTSVEGVYALGDVAGNALLTPVAIAAGRRLAHRLFHGEEGLALDYSNIPSVVFSHPPIGSIGLTEREAVLQHGEEQVKGAVQKVARLVVLVVVLGFVVIFKSHYGDPMPGDRVPDQVHAPVPRPHHQEATNGGRNTLTHHDTPQYTTTHHNTSPTTPSTMLQVMKLVCLGETQRVVGLHMLGRGCDEMLQVSSN